MTEEDRNMTNRERVLTVLRGEIPDRVPFSPNIGQWFSAKRATNALPPSLADCRDEVDAMLKLGWDIFSRRVVSCLRAIHHSVQTHSWRQDDSQFHQYLTPKGALTEESSWQADSHTTYKKRYYVRDWEADYPAFRYLIENTEYRFDEASYQVAEKRIGEAGVIIVPFAQSPIKLLHNFAGQEQATFFMLDHESEVQELCELHTEHLLKVAKVAAMSRAFVFMSMDNLDNLFHSPELFRRYSLGFYQRIAEVLHAAGKYWFSHACGRLNGLGELMAEAQLDGVEGMPHPPLGDLSIPEALKIRPNFVVIAGMTCHELEIRENVTERLREYVRQLFASIRPFRGFVFSTACNTPITTPWENLCLLQEYCYEFGQNRGR